MRSLWAGSIKTKLMLLLTANTMSGAIWSCLEVSDTAIGIAEDDKGKLFQAFSQVDSSSTRRHGGTGLGLAISQSLIRMMGCWIEFETELGKGSTFTIYLPRSGEGRAS